MLLSRFSLPGSEGLRNKESRQRWENIVPWRVRGSYATNHLVSVRHFGSSITDEEAIKERKAAEERFMRHESIEDASQNRALLPKTLSWNTVARALIGNSVITLLKFGVFIQTGSAAMLSEAVHTLADSGNQMLLLKGLQQASQTPDKRFQYGYGKASFFWALVSALGMFWTGAGVSLGHGLYTLIHPPELFEISREMLGVLFVSFLVDGFVLGKTLKEVAASKPANISMMNHFMNIRDPFVLAVLFEDAAACTGVVFAGTGILLSQLYGDVSYDTLAGIGVGMLLASVAIKLVEINYRFLVGQAVDEEIVSDIRNMLRNRPAINAVYDVQSQWLGPHAFAFKAECDFNGYVLARRLEDLYVPLFIEAVAHRTDKSDPAGRDDKRKYDLETVMAWMAEDVTRLIEQEVKQVELLIRQKHPMAAFIELEPDSKKSFLRASDGRAWRENDPMSPLARESSARLSRAYSAIQDYELARSHSSVAELTGALTESGEGKEPRDALKAEAAKTVTTLLRDILKDAVEKKKAIENETTSSRNKEGSS